MATIYKELRLDVPPDELWRDLRDFGNPGTLFPSLIATTELADGQRVCTLADGSEVRERLVTIDDERRRLVYYVAAGPLPLTHHNSSMQLLDDNGGSCFVWITEVLPDEAASALDGVFDAFLQELQATLAQRAA